jgi:hypothetical protein
MWLRITLRVFRRFPSGGGADWGRFVVIGRTHAPKTTNSIIVRLFSFFTRFAHKKILLLPLPPHGPWIPPFDFRSVAAGALDRPGLSIPLNRRGALDKHALNRRGAGARFARP